MSRFSEPPRPALFLSMAQHARKTTPAKTRAGLPSLLTLLVLLAGVGLSHQRLLQVVVEQECVDEVNACFEDEECSECTFSFHEEGTCTNYIVDQANAECSAFGVAYCCGAEAAGSGLEACLDNPAAEEVWQCALEANGCTMADMPCFGSSGSAVGSSESRSISSESAVGYPETISTSAGTDDPAPATDVLTSAASSRGSCAAVVAAAAAAAVGLAVSFAG